MTNLSSLMSGGTSSGVTGQLDVQWIVEQLIYAKQQPIRDLEVFETYYEAKRDAFQELNTKVSAVESALYSLNNSGFSSKSASVSTEDYLAASASSSASTGKYSVIVEQLAAAQSDTSSGFSSASDKVLEFGTVTIKNYDGTETLGEVDFSTGSISLNQLKDEINDMDIGVTATVINFGTSASPAYRIQLTADETGVENGFTVTETDSGGGTLPGFTNQIAAADSYIYVNTGAGDTDYRIIRSSNTITDVISGVTLNLKDADVTKTTTLTVESDSSNLKENIQTFVDSFNEVITYLNAQFTYNEDTEAAGVLSGESAARKVKDDLLSFATSRVQGIDSSDSYNSFSIIGLELNRQGQLEINETKLDDAIENHLDSVKRIFKNVGTTSNSEVSYVGKSDATVGGTYEVFVTRAATQGTATGGSSIETLTSDETLTVWYNNKEYQVALTSGLTANQVVSAINSAMDSAGVPVYAQVTDTGELQLLTDDYGSSQQVKVKSNVAAGAGTTGIGLSYVTDGKGVDVAGKFVKGTETYTASGSGRALTGLSGDAEGLKVYITTSSVTDTVNGDSKGTVYFTRGVAEGLRERMFEISFPYSGLIAKNIDSFDDKLQNISDQIKTINRQLEAEQELLIDQFTRANEALAQMTYLQSTISNNLS
jgi:flagellar hook-associated protein 2